VLLQCGRLDLQSPLRIWSCVVTVLTVRFARDVANLKLCCYSVDGSICKARCESEVVLLQCGRLDLQSPLRIWSCVFTVWKVRFARPVANLKLYCYSVGGQICKARCESEVVLLQCWRLNLQGPLRIWSCTVTVWEVKFAKPVANLKLCCYNVEGQICKTRCESEAVLLQCWRLNLQGPLRIWRCIVTVWEVTFAKPVANLKLCCYSVEG